MTRTEILNMKEKLEMDYIMDKEHYILMEKFSMKGNL